MHGCTIRQYTNSSCDFASGKRESRKEAGIMGEQWTHGPIMVRQMPLKGPGMQDKNGRK